MITDDKESSVYCNKTYTNCFALFLIPCTARMKHVKRKALHDNGSFNITLTTTLARDRDMPFYVTLNVVFYFIYSKK